MENPLDRAPVTCRLLWKQWQQNMPDSPMLLSAKERISSYKKEDWDTMVKEAYELNAYLANLINTNSSLDSKESEIGFDMFADHYIKWFFPIDEEYILKLVMATQLDKKYALFFENQAPGLGLYLPKLLHKYAYKLSSKLE
jgi:hypothetical protein